MMSYDDVLTIAPVPTPRYARSMLKAVLRAAVYHPVSIANKTIPENYPWYVDSVIRLSPLACAKTASPWREEAAAGWPGPFAFRAISSALRWSGSASSSLP